MVILVDKNDFPIGVMPKMEAHEKGCLHRAFSIFIFNSSGELLLQKRAEGKYHSPGLWTNTCCSHPEPGQETVDAARERLLTEMGLHAKLEYLMKFTYRSSYENGLIEHEIDHIFVGSTDDTPHINPNEISEYKYMSINDIQKDVALNPEKYTTWFRIISENFMSRILSLKVKLHT